MNAIVAELRNLDDRLLKEIGLDRNQLECTLTAASHPIPMDPRDGRVPLLFGIGPMRASYRLLPERRGALPPERSCVSQPANARRAAEVCRRLG